MRTEVSLLIDDPDVDEGDIAAIGTDDTPIGRQLNMVGLACRVHLLHLSLLSLRIVGHHTYRSRLIAGLHPHQAVSFLAVESLL